MSPPSFTEQLANLPILYILYFVIAATIVRVGLVRANTDAARSFAELVESAVIAVVLVFLILRPFVVQAYFIPSPSMVPTLLGKNGSGDRILVNKLLYRYSKPNRDDVVVFIPPASATEPGSAEEASGAPVNFIKRLIAKPGDILQVKAGRVWINNNMFSHADIRTRLQEQGSFGSDGNEDPQADHHIKFTNSAVVLDGKAMPSADLAKLMTGMTDVTVRVQPGQTILNGKVLDEPFIAEDPDYDLKLYKGEPLKDDSNSMRLSGVPISKTEYDVDNAAPPGSVPPNCYFMMGDNRNDSKDSTEWGPLPAPRIVGRAQFIFYPLNRIRVIH